jgi:ABC-type glycerol-3-phosphate transport system substrate-binding protein
MPNALDSFISGQTAFFFGYNYHYNVIKGRAPQLSFDVIPMLQLSPESKVNTTNYWLQTVTAKSKHANEAWALIDYLTRSPANKKYLEKTGRPTALRANISDQLQKPELAPFVSQILNAENWYYGKNYAAADKALQDIYTEWIKTSDNSLEEDVRIKSILNRAAVKFNQTF